MKTQTLPLPGNGEDTQVRGLRNCTFCPQLKLLATEDLDLEVNIDELFQVDPTARLLATRQFKHEPGRKHRHGTQQREEKEQSPCPIHIFTAKETHVPAQNFKMTGRNLSLAWRPLSRSNAASENSTKRSRCALPPDNLFSGKPSSKLLSPRAKGMGMAIPVGPTSAPGGTSHAATRGAEVSSTILKLVAPAAPARRSLMRML